ncbi:MAG: amidohydrolase family protein [Acidimicrobiaceae bacterium]|nr:amidohydrolase family protein [Acidimicrobiaceae bacterium]
MAEQPPISELVAAGAARIPATTVVRGGRLVNVVSAEVYEADVAVYGNTVVALGDVSAHTGGETEIVDAAGRHLVPGLFDGHQHIECSKLSITSAAKMLVPLGTINVVSGLDQILVVAGLDGAEAFLRESQGTPLRVLWGAPCKTPYTLPTSTVGHYFGPDDHRAAQRWPECVGVWETVREFVTTGDPDVLAAMELARENRLPVLGCAPMATGADLTSYACGGIRLDHESYDSHECLEKLRNGMYIVIRESSFAHFLTENIRLVLEHAPGSARRVSFCTDDVVASDVLDRGHLDNMVRMAVDAGVDPMTAIQMATINGAEAYRVDHMVGSISPGRYADILFVDDLDDFRPSMVMAGGQVVARDGEMTIDLEPPSRDGLLTGPFPMAPATAEDFAVRTGLPDGPVEVLAIEVTEQIFVRKRRDVVLQAVGGRVQPDIEADLALVSVVERYGKNSNRPTAFVAGFGIRSGALATSSAPDDNNIVVIGTSPEDMAAAVNHIAAHGGGQVVVDGCEVVEFLPLPIGGIVSDLDPPDMLAEEERLDRAAKALGCTVDWPFMYLFFLPITSIPDYAITDVGTVDVAAMDTFDPVLGPAAA